MTRKQKLYERLKNNPGSGTFEDVHNLLTWCGFELRRVTGAHHIYKRAGHDLIITVPRHKPLKAIYVKQALAVFETFFNPEA